MKRRRPTLEIYITLIIQNQNVLKSSQEVKKIQTDNKHCWTNSKVIYHKSLRFF